MLPQMPPMLAQQPVQEKYWDLASVPGYDPSFLVGWRLSNVWTQRERQENSLAEGWRLELDVFLGRVVAVVEQCLGSLNINFTYMLSYVVYTILYMYTSSNEPGVQESSSSVPGVPQKNGSLFTCKRKPSSAYEFHLTCRVHVYLAWHCALLVAGLVDCGMMLSATSWAHGLEDSRTRHFTRAAVQRMGPLVLCPELSCKVGPYLFSRMRLHLELVISLERSVGDL